MRDVPRRTTVIDEEMRIADSGPHPIVPPSDSAHDPAPAVGDGTFLRFRDRARARSGTADLLTFRIGTERFAFDIRAVDEILDDAALQPVPEAPAPLIGVTSYRGRPLAVFEPAGFLGITHRVGATVLVMRSGERRIGLVVDDVDDVESFDLSMLAPPPFDAGDDLLLGVVWRDGVLTSVVDARALVGACHVAAAGRTA